MNTQSLKPGWKLVKFGDAVQNVSVRVDPAEAETDVYVGLEHLDPSTLHLRKWGHPSDVTGQKLAFKKGDVIFGRRRAYQRKLAVAEFDGICSAHAMVVRAKPKMILPEFLPFFLQSDMFMDRAIAISVGSLSPTINWTALKVLEFPLPPLDEQKRIAEILWAADEAAEQWRRVYSVLNILISVHRVEFFSRKNWPTKKLEKLFAVQLGKMLSPKAKTGKYSFPYLANYNVQWDRRAPLKTALGTMPSVN
jgi:type I restriction enzyme, S subunit